MPTREHRIAEFSAEPPPLGVELKVLCEDHVGTYALPFKCRWTGAVWVNANTGVSIEGKVLGWRAL
jgi:hypothetical protein